jgi:hypothetical protein
MRKRGKVLRDTTSGPGLLIIEGQQYRFSLQGVWKSETPPKPGLVVDVEIDDQGIVQSVTVVPASQFAQEQAEAAIARTRPRPSRVGMSTLATTGALLAAWFFLTAASIQVPFPGKLEFTFWQLLGFLSAGNVPGLLDGRGSTDTGLYGLVAIAAMTGPFIYSFWKDRRALLGGILPLLFMVIVGIALRSNIQTALGGVHANQARDESMKAVSIGIGTYVSVIAGLYLALISAKDFLATKVRATRARESAQRKAA